MFEGDFADMCAIKSPLMSMGGRAEGLACTDPGVRTPIGMSGNFYIVTPSPSHLGDIWPIQYNIVGLYKILQGIVRDFEIL